MSYTVKYRCYNPCATQPQEGPTHYDQNEQIHGPFTFVSQEMQDGLMVVHAHRGEEAIGMMFGPHRIGDLAAGQEPPPRPSVWVMNESGATVAKYDL